MHSNKALSMKAVMIFLSHMLIALLLTACGNSEDAQKLKAALEINTLNITSLEVTSPRTVMEVSATEQFTAMAIIANGDKDPVDVSNKVEWSNTDTSSATINSAGELIGKATESTTVTVTATLADLSASKDIRLSNAPLVSIDILNNPSPVSVCRGGFQINANGNFEDENEPRPYTDKVTWTSDSPDILTIDETGAFSTFKDGTAIITASKDAIESTATVIVNDDIASITISSDSDTINIGETLSFTANGTYDDASTADITNNVNWESDTPAALTISNEIATKGVATGVSEDMANISATCLSTSAVVSNEALITVNEAPVINGVSINEGTNSLEFKIIDSPEQLTARLTRSDSTFSTFVTDDDNIRWLVKRTISGQALTVSNEKGSKGEITFTAAGITEVEIRYDDNDENIGPFFDVIEIEVLEN